MLQKQLIRIDELFWINMYKIALPLFISTLFFYNLGVHALGGNSLLYWQCIAVDANNNLWSIYNKYEIAALNKALDKCKKESKEPLTCKISRNSCEIFINGISTSQIWLCRAFDAKATAWPSSNHKILEHAALDAVNYCKEHSQIPETCYINVNNCRNINPHSANVLHRFNR